MFQTMKEVNANEMEKRRLKKDQKKYEMKMNWKKEYKADLVVRYIAEEDDPNIKPGMEKVQIFYIVYSTYILKDRSMFNK